MGSAGGLFAAISSKTGQKPKDVKAVFTSLQGIATTEVTKTGKFAIPQVVMLKLKPARPAGKRMMFGKEVKVAAKKASKVVKAFPHRPSRRPSEYRAQSRCGRCPCAVGGASRGPATGRPANSFARRRHAFCTTSHR